MDTNCIIALEKKEKFSPSIRKLIQMHKEGKIALGVVAISASERLPNGKYLTNFKDFLLRIKDVGLSEAKILEPLAYLGITFLGYFVLHGKKSSELEERIQKIIHPNFEMEYEDYCKKCVYELDDPKAWRKWVNAKCDVLAMWSHIWYKGDIFVTTDNRFFKIKKICTRENGSWRYFKTKRGNTETKIKFYLMTEIYP